MRRIYAIGGSRLRSAPERSRAFSLIELLVVLAIIATLGGLLLPTLSRTHAKAQGAQCLNNGRQLMLGWLMYADDQDGSLCPNGASARQAWVPGVMNFDYNAGDNTNTAYLSDPQFAKLAPYVSNAALYRCPSDRSLARAGGRSFVRVRSIAMNDAVGAFADGALLPSSLGWRTYRKMNELVAPAPSSLWVLIEQHPDSINDGRFAVDCQNRNAAARIIDFPASFHAMASNVSFADGHGEMRKWVDETLRPPLKYCGCLSHYASEGYFVSAPNSPDLAWLQERTSAKRK